LRKVYGQSIAAGYPENEKLSQVLLKLNEKSLSQLRRDHKTGHLEHKIANTSAKDLAFGAGNPTAGVGRNPKAAWLS
jgi:hypothetical protein